MNPEKILGKKEIVFIAKFFIIFLALQFLILTLPIMPLKVFIAETAAGSLGMQAVGDSILLDSHAFVITENCTGLLSGAILAALIFSVKKPGIRKKVFMAVAGAVGLFLLNFPRIFFVLWAARNFGVENAELFHEITWFSTAVFVFAIWFFEAKKIAQIKNFAEMI